jgi:hypothetical protein
MTDESKPKVEPWMREACEALGLGNPLTGHDSTCEDCEIIASAFARSRPAVAAGDALGERKEG